MNNLNLVNNSDEIQVVNLSLCRLFFIIYLKIFGIDIAKKKKHHMNDVPFTCKNKYQKTNRLIIFS